MQSISFEFLGGGKMFGKKRAGKTSKTAKNSSRSNVEASKEMSSSKTGNCSAKSTNSSKSKKA